MTTLTNKDQALISWGIMSNAQNPIPLRQSAEEELLDIKKRAKTSWEKLGIAKEVFEAEQQALIDAAAPISDVPDYGQDLTQAMPIDPLAEPVPAIDPLDALEQAAQVAFETPKLIKPAKPSGDQRGLISAEVRCLLMDTDDSYKLIVEAVKAKFPDANTTTRSVASVAAELRKNGVTIAFRRPSKGA